MFSSIHKYVFFLVFFITLCFIGLVFSLNSIGFINNLNLDANILTFDTTISNFIWPTPRL